MKTDLDLFKINNTLDPKSGRILFSEPLAKDVFFGRSVVLITENNDMGTVGFILNKPTKIFLDHFLESFNKYKIPVFVGGPVATDTLHFIHSVGTKISNSVKIGNELYWGGNINEIPDLLEKGEVLPADLKFFIGYSGWDSGQLSTEIQNNLWVVSTLPVKSILDHKTKDMWRKVVRDSGDAYKFWLNVPKDHIMN